MVTWEAFANAARDHGFRGVSARALLKAAYEDATPEQRRRGVVHSTHARVRAQIARWPDVSAEVREVRERLLAWTGDREEICTIRDDAHSAYVYAAADDAEATSAAHVVAADADDLDDADADDFAAAASSTYAAWDNLLYICRLLDGVEPC